MYGLRLLGCIGLSILVHQVLLEDVHEFDCTKDGDIMKLKPTGASKTTAQQDKLKVTGVPASNKLVDADRKRLNKFRKSFEECGKKFGIHPALLAAIASRESRGGKGLKKNGMAKFDKNGYGLMQCDTKTSGLQCKKFPPKSKEHICMMVEKVIIPNIKAVQKKHPTWPLEKQLQGAVAAYNFGVKNVQTLAGIDVGTTGNDYSNDVIARAQRLVKQHGWKCVCPPTTTTTSTTTTNPYPPTTIPTTTTAKYYDEGDFWDYLNPPTTIPTTPSYYDEGDFFHNHDPTTTTTPPPWPTTTTVQPTTTSTTTSNVITHKDIYFHHGLTRPTTTTAQPTTTTSQPSTTTVQPTPTPYSRILAFNHSAPTKPPITTTAACIDKLTDLGKRLREQDTKLKDQEKKIKEQDELLQEKDRTLEDWESFFDQFKKDLEKKLQEQEKKLKDQEKKIKEQEDLLHEKDRNLEAWRLLFEKMMRNSRTA